MLIDPTLIETAIDVNGSRVTYKDREFKGLLGITTTTSFELSGTGITTREVILYVRSSDVEGIRTGDEIYVDDVTYKVRQYNNLYGFTRIDLERS